MKKMLVGLMIAALLGLAGMAFAHGGGGYGYGGHMMGNGHMGYGMMGNGGYGSGHMMERDSGYGYDKETKEFLDKTANLRKELHEKRFEYMEAWRDDDEKKAEKLAKELDELAEEVRAVTSNSGNLASEFRISSVRPSAK